MITPERYGLTPLQTLAHVAKPSLTHGDHQFWHALRRRLGATEPLFERLGSIAAFGDPGVTHVIRSADGVRIGVVLSVPEGDVRGGVVELHGYAPGPFSDRNRYSERGLALIQARVRGFPGSLADAQDIASCETGWITHRIETPERWSLTGAVLDVSCVILAARRALRGLPVFVRAESFGAGLGVLACALLDSAAPERLAIGLPSLGDWRCRLRHAAHAGAGGEIARYITLNRAQERSIVESLLLLDSALHARFVRVPTLCKLAIADEVVPAPSAAAVFNALATDPARKRRFITGFGHFDAGIAEARRHAAFERAVLEFFDPAAGVDDALHRAVVVVETTVGRRAQTEAIRAE